MSAVPACRRSPAPRAPVSDAAGREGDVGQVGMGARRRVFVLGDAPLMLRFVRDARPAAGWTALPKGDSGGWSG